MKKIFTIAAAILASMTMMAQITLVDIDFTDASWSDKTFSQGNTANYDVINGVYFYAKNSDAAKQFSLADNATKGLTLPNSNMSASTGNSGNYYLCIPLTGINDEITIVFTHKYNSAKANYYYQLIEGQTEFQAGNTGGSGLEAKDANNADTQITVKVTTSEANGHLIIGRKSSNFVELKGIKVTTLAPVTKHALAWDFAGGECSAVEGTDYTAAGQVAEGAAIKYPADNTMTKEGFDFAGWSSDATVMPTSDLTITALWTAHVVSSDATLASLKVNDADVEGFAAATEEYYVVLPFGTTEIPVVTATANSPYAQPLAITQATAVNGNAIVVVTAEDNSTKTYTIHFSVSNSQEIELVWKKESNRCDGTKTPNATIKSNDASVAALINQITFTNVEGTGDDAAEGGSLNLGKKAGNMLTLSTKAGFAIEELSFFGKIQDATCEYSLDGGEWVTLTSTNTGSDACYELIENGVVKELRIRSTGAEGVWIRNMQLAITAVGPATAIDNTEASVKAVKRIVNGQLFIEKNGVLYNAQGAIVK